MEMMALLPPRANLEPTPADKDPAPLPFDSTYNTPEHDEWVARVKYIRDDRFIYEHVLDDAASVKLDHAWDDLHASFEYYDNYLDLLSKKFNYELKIKHMSELTPQMQLAHAVRRLASTWLRYALNTRRSRRRNAPHSPGMWKIA